MKEYKVSWTDIRGNEFFSEEYGYDEALQLYNEICADKVDNEQIEARLYNSDILLKRFDNIENKYYKM
ncbi:hypothetical protein [Terrisporobacter glycolicus]|uniref:Uncharacterized protein n=1 Tax=Terrisporobacter glycolicus ATCC 14880 = DSM 1288 TaxID=1121315 RepID=A0ABZ2EVZ2_9FIRM|nr:hypothetical protein [Terrisporobacter glycolicus]